MQKKKLSFIFTLILLDDNRNRWAISFTNFFLAFDTLCKPKMGKKTQHQGRHGRKILKPTIKIFWKRSQELGDPK